MSPTRLLIAFALLCSTLCASAQLNPRDSSTALIPLTMSYSYQLPSASLAERFGANHNLAFSAGLKLRSNYIFGVQGSFIFGGKVKQPGLLQNMINSQGQILNSEGEPAGVLLQQRGYSIMAYVGKILPVAGPNKNSGMLIRLGAGYLRHKIRIETQEDEVPQLENNNLHGYDRLSAGPAAYMFIGYRHFSNNRRVNFVVGYEIIQGFTEPLRAFNFDTEQADTDTRYDALNGLRFGWTIPIYQDKPEKIFLY